MPDQASERLDAAGRRGRPDAGPPGRAAGVTGVFEPDLDEDLVGDTTEDRTDLRVSATGGRGADGRAQVTVTITNAGPLAADLPT